MSTASVPARRPFRPGYALAGGLVVGTLDIVYACTFWGLKRGVPAQRIFQSVAAGLLGKASFDGGAETAALGLGLHYLIATSMSVVYYLAARRLPLLWQRPVLRWIGLSVVVHVLLIGIPIALFTRRASALG
jgi:hypothetical protein